MPPPSAALKGLRGEKSLFGKGEGLEAYKDFEHKLRNTILALVSDGIIERNAQPDYVRKTICNVIYEFGQAFPNWQDAYTFAAQYFAGTTEAAEERIQADLTTIQQTPLLKKPKAYKSYKHQPYTPKPKVQKNAPYDWKAAKTGYTKAYKSYKHQPYTPKPKVQKNAPYDWKAAKTGYTK